MFLKVGLYLMFFSVFIQMSNGMTIMRTVSTDNVDRIG